MLRPVEAYIDINNLYSPFDKLRVTKTAFYETINFLDFNISKSEECAKFFLCGE